jgi:hypothetical protein|tara:strand:- start:3446 stop:3745 length:300 start_codon:yes stop_codon:yes gene_type:complete
MSNIETKNGKKYKLIDEEIISICPDKDMLKVPLFCPVCNFVMNSADDTECFESSMCCNTCFVKWAESRKKDWNSGWRPTVQEIKIEKEIRRKMHVKFHF